MTTTSRKSRHLAYAKDGSNIRYESRYEQTKGPESQWGSYLPAG
jgi:hypothetical protein